MSHLQAVRCSPAASRSAALRSFNPPCTAVRRAGVAAPLEQVTSSSRDSSCSSRCQPASCISGRGHRVRTFAAQPPNTPPSEEFDGLLPEEDAEVPGGYWDALNGNTKLGKAVRAACDELEHLNTLEMGVLEEAEGLLKKLGMKGSLFTTPSSSSISSGGGGGGASSSSSSSSTGAAEAEQQQQGAGTQQ